MDPLAPLLTAKAETFQRPLVSVSPMQHHSSRRNDELRGIASMCGALSAGANHGTDANSQ